MKSHALLLYAFLHVVLVSCGQKEKKTETTPAPDGISVPMAPPDILNELMDQCTGIDYVFKDLPISLSFQEEPGIDQNIAFIDHLGKVDQIPPDCKPIAKKYFVIKGEIKYEADVYLSDKCRFYVFTDKNRKPLYANQMTEAGAKYYKQVLGQAQGMGQPTQ